MVRPACPRARERQPRRRPAIRPRPWAHDFSTRRRMLPCALQQVLREFEIPHVYHVVNGIDHDIARYYDAVGLEGLQFLAKHFRRASER